VATFANQSNRNKPMKTRKIATYTAIITPFTENRIDINSLEKLISRQINAEIDGIVPCGTTGESPTLSHSEHNKIIEIAVANGKGKIKIMAGTGSNSTAEAVEMTKIAKKAGADSCLIVTPYYNKPTPQGLFEHFTALNKCDIPLYIYNIPGRSVINMSDSTIAKIAQLENVAGIKDATGDLARLATLRVAINESLDKSGKEFSYLSGEDATIVGYNAMGGNGVISVLSNLVPEMVVAMQRHCANGNYKDAVVMQDKLTKLTQALFLETSPIPIKFACSLLGLCTNEIRLPLTMPSQDCQRNLEAILQQMKLI
jgi:4-hydroxy-tetrahydrodipicolinate synthase